MPETDSKPELRLNSRGIPPLAGGAAVAAPGQVEIADIDLSLLEDSLRLTPWQRLVENERALALVRMLEAAHPVDGTVEPTA